MSTTEATARLGVKPQTLYAYVSRGLLRSERVQGQRQSRFLRSDVERLAAKSRAGGRAGRLEVIIDTELTLLDPAGRLSYRGWDVTDAAATSSYEQVAQWLWTGERQQKPAPWRASDAGVALARDFADVWPERAAPVDRLRIAVAALAPTDPMRHDRRPEAVSATAKTMVATLLEFLPDAGGLAAGGLAGAGGAGGDAEPTSRAGVPARASIARRLWPKLTATAPTPQRVAMLDDALVLLADHELAASTFAARVAASTWADPYLVVEAGLAALGGPLHGGASELVRQVLAEARAGTPADVVVGERLRSASLVPGFGHTVYETGDPRAIPLLDAIAAARPPAEARDAAAAVLEVVAGRGGPFPNVDFALACMADAFDMVRGAGEVIFAIARIAGWVAHALEEYQYRLRLRPRAAYTGPRPG